MLHNEELHNWHSSPYKKTEIGIDFSMNGSVTCIKSLLTYSMEQGPS